MGELELRHVPCNFEIHPWRFFVGFDPFAPLLHLRGKALLLRPLEMAFNVF